MWKLIQFGRRIAETVIAVAVLRLAVGLPGCERIMLACDKGEKAGSVDDDSSHFGDLPL